MMRTPFLAAALSIGLTGAANAQPGFAKLEQAEINACKEDGAWVHDAAVFTYFKDSYYDFDKHFRAFAGTLERDLETAGAIEDGARRGARYALLHDRIAALIPRLGRLLPRVERPLDLAPMAEQMRKGEIRDPTGDHHTEYLRVAFAREMLKAPASVAKNSGSGIADFLDSFAAVENQLLALKNGGDEDAEALRRNLQSLDAGYRDGFRPIAKHAIFASYANSFQGRLAFGVKEICNAQAMCAGADADETVCSEGGDKIGGGQP